MQYPVADDCSTVCGAKFAGFAVVAAATDFLCVVAVPAERGFAALFSSSNDSLRERTGDAGRRSQMCHTAEWRPAALWCWSGNRRGRQGCQ